MMPPDAPVWASKDRMIDETMFSCFFLTSYADRSKPGMLYKWNRRDDPFAERQSLKDYGMVSSFIIIRPYSQNP